MNKTKAHNSALSSFILSPSSLPFRVRLRTYPQHTRSWLPLLRSRPGGIHRGYVVRSPKSDRKHSRLLLADCRFACSNSVAYEVNETPTCH